MEGYIKILDDSFGRAVAISRRPLSPDELGDMNVAFLMGATESARLFGATDEQVEGLIQHLLAVVRGNAAGEENGIQ